MLALPRTLIARRAFTTSAPRNVAKMTLVGRLGADPEIITAENGSDRIRYVVGHSVRNKEGQDGPMSWFRVMTFDEGSMNYVKSLRKGSLVYVECDASLKAYENKDGVKTTALNLTQRKLQALGPKPQPEESTESESTESGSTESEEPIR